MSRNILSVLMEQKPSKLRNFPHQTAVDQNTWSGREASKEEAKFDLGNASLCRSHHTARIIDFNFDRLHD